MRAGYGRYEITPPLGVELGGYGYYLQRRARSVLDPLYARAVLLEDGAQRTLIISCDLLGLSDEVCGEVFERVAPLGVDAILRGWGVADSKLHPLFWWESLEIDGVDQRRGTYGATGSGAQHVNDTLFAGGGTLSVVGDGMGMVILFR